MNFVSKGPRGLFLLAVLAMPVVGTAQAQDLASNDDVLTTVYGERVADGPKVEGVITKRTEEKMQITTADGNRVVVAYDNQTKVKARGGFLGGGKTLDTNSLYNGLPVTVQTVQYANGLVATEVAMKNSDLKVAAIVHTGTAQKFGEHDEAIGKNAKMVEALRTRMADIDNYNIKGTTNVYFDSGKYRLTPEGQNNLCDAASQAEAMGNALLLVVGYTDSTGSYEVNQELSERRAGRVVNYLQQECGWKPWRMLSPTGMAASDPLADNSTAEGKAQNRRVSVNILVSKSIDEDL